jgi:hypothetical protein
MIKNDGMRRANDEQELGSPALQIIKLYVVRTEYSLQYIFNPEIPSKRVKVWGLRSF